MERAELDILFRRCGPAARRIINGVAGLVKEAEAAGLDHAIGALQVVQSRLETSAAEAKEELRSRAIGDPSCPAGYR